MAQRDIEWFTLEEWESVGKFPLQTTPRGDYICPKCGKPAEYWEGAFEQDRMGNDIEGWSYDCYGCKISTEITEC